MLLEEIAIVGVQNYSSAGGDNDTLFLGDPFQEFRFRFAKGFPAFGLNPLVYILTKGSDQTFVHIDEGQVKLLCQKLSHKTFACGSKTNERDVGFSFHFDLP